MRKFRIGGRILTDKDCFVIAEIGANHAGDLDLCEKMIIEAAKCGVDAVKMQKRDNAVMFTKAALARPYDNGFSYGRTYGEHRAHLDWFGKREFIRFKTVAEKHGVLFFATPFEAESARFLHELGVPLWKIASCDVTNLPLVRQVAGYGQPLIISTGGASMADIRALVGEIHSINDDFAILHCVSTYPNEDSQLNLDVITALRAEYPHHVIGFSSHHPGILPLVVARTKGASIFEVHFTLNRGAKGTDHGFSMEPRGLETICQDLKRVQMMLGVPEKVVLPEEKGGFVVKMGKGIYLNKPLVKGTIITGADIVVKSPAGGFRPGDTNQVVGRMLISDLSTGVSINEGMIE